MRRVFILLVFGTGGTWSDAMPDPPAVQQQATTPPRGKELHIKTEKGVNKDPACKILLHLEAGK